MRSLLGRFLPRQALRVETSPNIDIVIGPRWSGRTTAMLQWVREAPDGEHRVLICHTSQEAMRLWRQVQSDPDTTGLYESWQFAGIGEVERGAWGGVLMGRGGQIVLGIDNIDLVLNQMLGFRVGRATWEVDRP